MIGSNPDLASKQAYRKEIIFHLYFSVLIFLFIFAVNAYLVVFVNNGFAKSPTDWHYHLTYLINVRDTPHTSIIVFWVLLSMLITFQAIRIRKFGIKRFFLDMLEALGWLIRCVRNSGKSGLITFLLCASASLLLSLLTDNPFVILVVAIAFFLSFTARERSAFLSLIVAGWHRFLRKGKEHKLNPWPMCLGIFGLFAGFLISYFLPFKPVSALVLAVGFVVITVLLKTGKIDLGTAVTLAGFCVLNIFLFRANPAWAHDGGFKEAGSTLRDWIRSDGAGTAVSQGIHPSLWGAITSGMCAIFPPIAGSFCSIATSDTDPKDTAEAIAGLQRQGSGRAFNRNVDRQLEEAGFYD